jgi:hypothetical protein
MALQLSGSRVVQEAVTSNTVDILQLEEDLQRKEVRALVKTSDEPYQQEWVVLWSGDTYTLEWSQEDAENRVVEIFNEKFFGAEESSEESAEG